MAHHQAGRGRGRGEGGWVLHNLIEEDYESGAKIKAQYLWTKN